MGFTSRDMNRLANFVLGIEYVKENIYFCIYKFLFTHFVVGLYPRLLHRKSCRETGVINFLFRNKFTPIIDLVVML